MLNGRTLVVLLVICFLFTWATMYLMVPGMVGLVANRVNVTAQLQQALDRHAQQDAALWAEVQKRLVPAKQQ